MSAWRTTGPFLLTVISSHYSRSWFACVLPFVRTSAIFIVRSLWRAHDFLPRHRRLTRQAVDKRVPACIIASFDCSVKEGATVIGFKQRVFAPLGDRSLEALV